MGADLPAADDELETVTVVGNGVSNMEAASAGDVTQLEIPSQPLLRPGAVLESVPGLIVTQHSGEEEASQYIRVHSTWIMVATRPRKWMTCPDFVVHPGVPLTVRASFQYLM